MFEKAINLNDFSVEIRYPDNIIELSEEDITQAIGIAKEFRDFVLGEHDNE